MKILTLAILLSLSVGVSADPEINRGSLNTPIDLNTAEATEPTIDGHNLNTPQQLVADPSQLPTDTKTGDDLLDDALLPVPTIMAPAAVPNRVFR